ncbi:dienelactone hydrolase [Bradyrhizobium sp. Arg816]|uniref:alpha/beta hydrolase family protein n=1 Tax=Bradyrhizobium sp. Arg816 TaxID=2998491 RepID=UPI00249DCDEF|nr:dienelactone hydrolase [Bradyrhizobium sp. Arg816]MDI3560519.1 dienelactone hydrolase [Bradyrhizobium sp. Arg816]
MARIKGGTTAMCKLPAGSAGLRILAAAIVLSLLVSLAAGPSPARADGRYQAGVARITVPDAVPLVVLVAYPTDAAEAAFESGPFTIRARRDAPIALAKAFPVLLFSHGNGRGGSPLNHRDLITALARQGFIVIAPFHAGTKPLRDRPRQLHEALDQVLADQRFAAQVDRSRLGIVGYSFGGAVALIAAGATPDWAHLVSYCRERTDDPRACDGIDTNDTSHVIFGQAADVLPLKALVLMEPFGAPFDREALTALTMPVLLYRAEHSDLRPEGNILALAAALPRSPKQESVPGGHLVFIDPCPPALEKEDPAACRDAADVDRVAIHRRIETEVADFFRDNLQARPHE